MAKFISNVTKRISLRRKLALIIGMMFVPYVLITSFLLSNMVRFYDEYNIIAENITIANKYNIEFKEQMDAVMYQMVIRSLNKEEVATQLGMKNPDEIIADAMTAFEELKKTSFSDDAISAAGSITGLLANLQNRVDDINKNVKLSGYYDQNVLSLDTDIRILTELVQEKISEYNYYEGATMETVRAEVGDRLKVLVQMTLLVFIIIAGVSLLLSTIISRSISSSIETLENAVEEFGQGNLNVRTKEVGDSELQALYESFNSMAGEIEVLVDNIKKEQINSRNLELKLLQAQINPHFLYNTLDNIVWLVEDDRKEDAENIVTYLAQFFRTTLSGGRDFIHLSEEFSHIEAYLKIQSFRYRDILSFELDLPEDLNDYLIIKMALQPIVENALYHGIKYKRSMGKITVRATEEDDHILIRVEDDGIGMEQNDLEDLRQALSEEGRPSEQDKGFGMANVAERLRMNYGETYGLTVESEYKKGTVVEVRFPKTKD